FEMADSGFSRVVPDDVMKREIVEFNLLGLQPAGVAPARHEVVLRDLNLLFFCVTRKLENFHAVTQSRRNRIEHIRCGDKEDTRQVERDIEVMIAESGVLLGIQYFEQRRRRIAS